MPATTTGGPFDLNVPSSTNDFADLYGTYLVPNMETINDNAAHKGVAQTFTAAQTFSTTLTVTAGGANIGGDVVVSSGSVTGVTLKAAGLTGATQVSRYVGATTSGAPSTGTFSVGDYVIDRSGAIHVCTTGGSPGTWTAIGNVTYGTPGSSAVGDSAAAGSATTSARSDHRHGREAFGSPTSLTFGGSSTDGTSSSPARADHVHGLGAAVTSVTAGTGISVSGTTTPTITNSGVTSIVAGTNVTVSGATGAVTVNAPGFATPGSSAIGDTAAAGTATTVSRSDHVHGREASGTPGASAVGDTASAGVATTVARSDHRHSREAFGTPIAVTGGATAASGSATTLARSDHIHSTASLGVVLASITLTSAAASVTVSSIPSGYTHLRIVVMASSVQTGVSNGTVIYQLNGDTGNNYYSANVGAYFGPGLIAGWTGAPNSFVVGNTINDQILCDYSSSTAVKYHSGLSVKNTSTTSIALSGSHFYGFWNSTAAVTSIVFKEYSGYNFAIGSKFSVIGF